ncbi:hypothetical protein CEXT_246941 [Caerostris extrusa]|uniref:Uncharacterized protein n=1 Tax=Caerostris extrusa TaxID=172846 RepID=A0AAV4UXY6_CAEEX|nr:hypothetical protein CEXT_246941 [Caerostris extrusa]
MGRSQTTPWLEKKKTPRKTVRQICPFKVAADSTLDGVALPEYRCDRFAGNQGSSWHSANSWGSPVPYSASRNRIYFFKNNVTQYILAYRYDLLKISSRTVCGIQNADASENRKFKSANNWLL